MAEQNTFAHRLKALREAAGISQYALAKKAGLSKQALSNLELGNREPSWVTVQRLAQALGADCSEFLDPALSASREIAPPRPRGRPRKEQPENDVQDQAKKPRGRPKKST